MSKAVVKWQVPGTYRGWVQAGKQGPEAKCAAHYAGAGASTLCGALPTRGNTPSQGFQHYKLHWYQVDRASARTVCRGCTMLFAGKPQPKPKPVSKPVAQVPVAQVA